MVEWSALADLNEASEEGLQNFGGQPLHLRSLEPEQQERVIDLPAAPQNDDSVDFGNLPQLIEATMVDPSFLDLDFDLNEAALPAAPHNDEAVDSGNLPQLIEATEELPPPLSDDRSARCAQSTRMMTSQTLPRPKKCDINVNPTLCEGEKECKTESDARQTGFKSSNKTSFAKHKHRLKKSSKGQKEEGDPVTAIRYNGQERTVTVWWEGYNNPTEEPLENMDGIDQDKLDEAQKRKGKRVKLTGSRCGATPERSGSMVPCHLELGSVRHPVVKHQEKDGFCALHSVANAILLPQRLYDFIRDKGCLFELEGVRALINEQTGTPCQLHRIPGVQKTDLLVWLRRQNKGIFVVEFNGHCVTWDAGSQLIIETDPGFPVPISITDQNLAKLGIEVVEKAFRLCESGEAVRRKGKKRQRRTRTSLAHNHHLFNPEGSCFYSAF